MLVLTAALIVTAFSPPCSSAVMSDRYVNKGPVESDKSIAEAMTGKAVIIYDVTSDPRAPYPQAAVKGMSSITSIPVVLRQRYHVLRRTAADLRSYSEEEIMFMTSLSEQAALALETPACIKSSRKSMKN